ncbi:MAG: tRNA adenosine(34) deaminase TadA [Clostridia bacterium]|nr:tRNA adenosine(34) deaminase TadA [Clostridia bacterium]
MADLVPDEKTDAYFMREALKEARRAFDLGEVPVGAVIVRNGEVVSTGHNRRETGKNALYHAEIEAIDGACKALGGWRLPGCTLYVTLEPCPMCAGAVINSRVERVVYGATDFRFGSVESVQNIFSLPYNHQPAVTAGVLGDECTALLREFFKRLREKGPGA